MFALCTERGRLEISARGEIVRLCHGETEYLETTAAAPLASVWYAEAASMWQATAWQELAPDNPTVSEIPGGVCVAADTFGGKAVRVRIEITADRREFRFRVTVRNDDAGVVAAVAAPRIEGFRDRGGDTLYVPNVSGRRAAQPFHAFRERTARYTYPVPLSSQFLTCNTGAAGWALFCFDETIRHKNLILGGPRRALDTVQYCFTEAGGTEMLAPVGLATYDGTWHAAADRYRDWFESWCRRPKLSRLVAEMTPTRSVVVRARPVDDPALPDIRKEMETGSYAGAIAHIREAKAQGYQGVHLVGWHDRGHDTDFPEYLPTERMGGKEEMKRMAAFARREGMSLCYYLNAHLCNVNSALYHRNKHWAIRTAAGESNLESYSSEQFVVACPMAEGFRRQIADRVRDLVENYAADSVQLDQVAARPSMLCFDRTHGHATPATAWFEGYRRMLCGVTDEMRAINPDFWIWIEGVSDAFGQFVDAQMAAGWTIHPGEETFVELYHYTLPWQQLLWPADPFLGGVPFWCKAPAALLAVLAPHADLLLHGRYMDTAGLSFDAARLRAHWHRAGGDVLLVAHNRTDAPVTARLELARTVLPAGTPPGTGVSLRDGRALVPVMREGTLQVEFPLPPGATDGVRCRFA